MRCLALQRHREEIYALEYRSLLNAARSLAKRLGFLLLALVGFHGKGKLVSTLSNDCFPVATRLFGKMTQIYRVTLHA